MNNHVGEDTRVVRGEFRTDGETFIFTLADLPLSGVGPTPQAAYDDLMRARERAGALSGRLTELAREQAGAGERVALIRVIGAVFIALTMIGGALGGAVVLAPRVVADVADTTVDKLEEWAAEMSPETRRNISGIFHPPPPEAEESSNAATP